MGKVDVGVITIGQSPRVDLTEDIKDILDENFNIVEKGALDDFYIDYVRENLYPEEGHTVLVSRMRNGEQVILSEEKIIPLIQQCIYDLEKKGCKIVILLCTGKFPEFSHSCILIYPQKIVHKLTQELLENKVLGIILPDKDQVEKIQSYWHNKNVKTKIAVASPYLSVDKIKEVCSEFGNSESIILMDCMGYSSSMKSLVSNNTDKVVILPRNIIFSIVNELI
jgi:protein AroM